MKTKLLSLLLLLPFFAAAQDSNIFYDRSFWRTSPNVAAVKAKVAAGNDPAALNPNAFDATVYAILENAPLETIKYLLSLEGNPVNKVTHDGRNYLLWAGYKGNIEVMKHLIAAGSDVELIDDHGYGLLSFTANAGQMNPKVYDLILTSGLSLEQTNRAGANALLLVAANLPGVKDGLLPYFLDKGIDLHAKDDNGNGIFEYATRKGNINLLKQLVDLGVAYNHLNKKGGNAMLMASTGSRGYSNPVEVYQYLAELGIEVDIVNFEGKTPLHNIASRTKDLSVIDFFVEKGVNVNQVDKDGNTAFLNAVRGNNLPVVKKLAKMVKNLDHTNHDGYSALTYAIRNNSVEAFDFLLDLGATLEVTDAKGNNLVYHMFDSQRADRNKAFDRFLQEAEKKKLNFKGAFENGNTLVHLAIEKGNKELLTKAIKSGVKINQKNEEGLTPLHLAAMKAHNQDLMMLLLENGADKAILTEFEESAFDLAGENEALIKNGIDIEFLKTE